MHTLRRDAAKGVFRAEPQRVIKGPGEEGEPKLLGLQDGLRVARTLQSTERKEGLTVLSALEMELGRPGFNENRVV